MLITVSSDDTHFYANALMLKAVQVANIPPVANNDTATTDENTPVDINVIANDTDSDGTIDPATVVITGNPANGAAVANANGTVTYTPDNGFDGTDTFTYTVNDNQGLLPIRLPSPLRSLREVSRNLLPTMTWHGQPDKSTTISRSTQQDKTAL